MQTTLDRPISPSTVSAADAQRVASDYIISRLNSSWEVVSGFLVAREQPKWRFILRSPYGPLGYLWVDAATGVVVPLTDDEIRIVQERALIAEAESQERLPVNEQGYVPSEYARRRANGYLNEHLSLHYSAINGLFVPLCPPVWQFTIQFRLPRLGSFILGTLDVNAQTGEPIALPTDQLERIVERTNALSRHQP
jgi:hypothetical protein